MKFLLANDPAFPGYRRFLLSWAESDGVNKLPVHCLVISEAIPPDMPLTHAADRFVQFLIAHKHPLPRPFRWSLAKTKSVSVIAATSLPPSHHQKNL